MESFPNYYKINEYKLFFCYNYFWSRKNKIDLKK